MSVESEFSGSEDQTASDSYEVKRNLLYRYEHGGILVYDSSSRFSDEEIVDFHYRPQRVNLKAKFVNKCEYPPMKRFPQEYTLVIPEHSLKFSSKFECGNLKKAVRLHENEYQLLLEYDTETLGYTQWYYFSVMPYKAHHKVRFNITNLMKYESLYNQGMKPLIFSEKNSENFQRNCSEVSYFRNDIQIPGTNKFFYTLTFSYTFEEPHEKIFFAYSYPYTYTKLLNYLTEVKSTHSSIFSCNTLCTTLAGNPCPVVTITNDILSYNTWPEELTKLNKSAAGRKILKLRELKTSEGSKSSHKNKKGVFISARVHPGESNSSFMVKGLIDFLIGNSREAVQLRKRFIFKIVPMLNPDGVIYGNYRCSLLGIDLNRRWTNPHKEMHPTIYYSKKLLQCFTEENEVLMYCDMHGHSIKKDVFMYGCFTRSSEVEDTQKNVFIRLIPYLMALKSPIFSYKDSKFRIEKSKVATGRVVNYSELGILSSYTLEASFFGVTSDVENHLTIAQLESLGKDLALVLLTFLNPRELRKRLTELTSKLSGRKIDHKEKELEEEEISIKDVIKDINQNQLQNIDLEDNDSGGSDIEGSDSDEKKQKFKKKIAQKPGEMKKVKKRRSIDNSQEIAHSKNIKTFKDIVPLRKSRIRENRSSSVMKEKYPLKEIDEKPLDLTEYFRLKSILHHSPIIFTREKVPNDSNLLNFSKKNYSKRNLKKNILMEKRKKLQIINNIKSKLDEIL